MASGSGKEGADRPKCSTIVSSRRMLLAFVFFRLDAIARRRRRRWQLNADADLARGPRQQRPARLGQVRLPQPAALAVVQLEVGHAVLRLGPLAKRAPLGLPVVVPRVRHEDRPLVAHRLVPRERL